MYIRQKLVYFLFLLLSACSSHTQSILSWNIRYDNPNDGPDRWELRREALVSELLRQKPAIAGFQEVLLGQLRFLEENLSGYRSFGVGRDDGKEKGEFSPVFYDSSLFQMKYGRTIWLSPTPGLPSKGWDAALPRIATLLVLKEKKTGDSLWVINTHFDHIGKEARLHAAELIVETLKPALDSGIKLVFMGDLNAEPNEPPIQYLRKHLVEACPEKQSAEGTFNGFDPKLQSFRRIDYVWTSPGKTRFVHYAVPRPMINGRHVSDHFPVLVKMR